MRQRQVNRGKKSDVSEEHRRGDMVCREGGEPVPVEGQSHKELSGRDLGKFQAFFLLHQIASCVSLIGQGPDIDNVVARNT